MSVKSEVNIWPFNHLIGRPYDVNVLLDRLSDTEVDTINDLWVSIAAGNAMLAFADTIKKYAEG